MCYVRASQRMSNTEAKGEQNICFFIYVDTVPPVLHGICRQSCGQELRHRDDGGHGRRQIHLRRRYALQGSESRGRRQLHARRFQVREAGGARRRGLRRGMGHVQDLSVVDRAAQSHDARVRRDQRLDHAARAGVRAGGQGRRSRLPLSLLL